MFVIVQMFASLSGLEWRVNVLTPVDTDKWTAEDLRMSDGARVVHD